MGATMMNFDYYDIPEHTRGALERYVHHGLMPGDFLVSVLTNDLFGALGRADKQNLMALRDICMFVYDEMPSNSWGTREKVEAFCKDIMANV